MHLPDKMYIIGGSGSGKSSLAKKISSIKHIPYFDLDDIMWFKKYTEKLPMQQRTYKLHHTILQQHHKRIIEGFAIDRAEECYQKADLVIILNVSKFIVVWRIFKRYVSQIVRGNLTQTFVGMIKLMIRAMSYQNPKSKYSLRRHIEDCEKYRCNYVVIRDAKEILE